jgi:hypothetical protein
MKKQEYINPDICPITGYAPKMAGETRKMYYRDYERNKRKKKSGGKDNNQPPQPLSN